MAHIWSVCRWRCRVDHRRYATTPDLDGERAAVKILSSRTQRFPKTLFSLSLGRIVRTKGFGDLLFRSPVHTDARDEEGYSGGVKARESKTLPRIGLWWRPLGSQTPSSNSISNVGLKVSTSSCSHGPLRFYLEMLKKIWVMPKFQQSSTRSQMPIKRFTCFSLLFNIPAFQ